MTLKLLASLLTSQKGSFQQIPACMKFIVIMKSLLWLLCTSVGANTPLLCEAVLVSFLSGISLLVLGGCIVDSMTLSICQSLLCFSPRLSVYKCFSFSASKNTKILSSF